MNKKGFWNKCIKKFNGQRKNISLCDNCSSSFIISKYNVSNEQRCMSYWKSLMKLHREYKTKEIYIDYIENMFDHFKINNFRENSICEYVLR